jgi:tight adherence protein B
MNKDATALLLLAGVIVVAMIGVWMFVSGSRRRAELAALGGGDETESITRRALARFDRRLRRTDSGQRLELWLQSGNVPYSPADFLLLCIGLALVVAMMLQLLMSPLVSLVAGGAIAIGAGRFYVERRRRERRDAFISQLPDLARVLSNGTAAGLSMPGAVELAAREMPDPAAQEMRSVVQEMRLGRPLDESLERLRQRLPSREVAVLMSTLIIQQRAGGDTVRALSELSATLDARKDLLREVKTLLAGSVFTSYIVAFIAVLTIVAANALSPGVLRDLTSTALGIAATTVTAMLWGIAFFLIRKTTKVDT